VNSIYRQSLAKGHAKPSYVHDLLQEENLSDEAMYDIKWSAASFYGGEPGASRVSAPLILVLFV